MAYPIIDLRSTPEGVLDTRRTVLDTKKAVLLPAGKKLSHPSLLPTHSPLSRLAVSLSGQAVLDTSKSKLETQRSVHSKTKSNLDTSLTESKDSKKVTEVESNSTSKKTNLTSSDPPASSHPSTSSTTSTSPVSSAVPPSSSKEYKKVRWIPDEERPACALCQNEFGFFLWRHHCRYFLLHEQ